MTPLDTCDAIERFLREGFEKVRLPSPDGGETGIRFYQMSLPQPGAQSMRPRPEDADGNELTALDPEDDEPLEDGGYTRNEARMIFPAVVIRPVKFMGGNEGDLWGTLTVVISAGVFDESDECAEGPKQAINILERSRQLFEKARILEKRHKIMLPVQYELYDESVRPFWFGEMITEWAIRLQAQELEIDNDYRLGFDGKGEGGKKYG
ncbi:MAG: hypothetical protein LBO21_01455 [Synergistaceae bacterium]|jgi:hypothetical protein|nr:hypothetical protein [Synergistaceae bacterium]